MKDHHAIGAFDDGIWAYPRVFTHVFFLFGLIALLHRCGLYALHSAALIRRGAGFLFVGKSGSGKSTTALALVRRGWKYLGDDALLLRHVDSRIEALAVPHEFKIGDQVFRRFFAECNEEVAFKIPQNDKWFLQVDRLYPKQSATRCTPQFLLYPEVTGNPQSRLLPLRKSEALERAIEASHLFQHDSTQTSRHLEALAALVRQTTAFQLLAGKDVLDDPASFEDLLLDQCQ